MKWIKDFGFVWLASAGMALAQPSITDVVNAGSRIGTGLPGAGIAQGAILVATGKGLGPETLTQATFPLPTTDGLAGVTVQVAIGGTTVNGIMVYAGPNEVAAILPSNTPTGTGELTVNNNGASAKAPITVVPAAFGAFTQGQSGVGAALAFNVGPDGTTTLNTLTQPAQTNQNVKLNGTGLGAIAGDETQSGLTDSPGTTLKLWVGTKEANVVSAARGTCCSSVDPAFAVPQGVAGWDVIEFVVPDGVTGCHVPVAVQIGNLVSNFATIAVANGSSCTDPGGFDSSVFQQFTGSSFKVGAIYLSRSAFKISITGLGTAESKSDNGGASFIQYDLSQIQSSASALGNVSAVGSCVVSTSRVVQGQPPSFTGPTYTPLNAGDALNVKGPAGTKQMTKTPEVAGTYLGDFGTSMVLPPIPGLPPGVSIPGLPASAPPFLEAGSYSVDNGAGGSDVGAFTATMAIPTPMTWTNQDQITAVTRSQGVTVRWTGGASSAEVLIIGTSSNRVGTATLTGSFYCTAPASAGEFTVPAIVTLSLPASSTSGGTVPGAPSSPLGTLGVQSLVNSTFNAPGIDIGVITSSVAAMKNLGYQ
jgi:uncharacterized protein (TIGR03437 family)